MLAAAAADVIEEGTSGLGCSESRLDVPPPLKRDECRGGGVGAGEQADDESEAPDEEPGEEHDNCSPSSPSEADAGESISFRELQMEPPARASRCEPGWFGWSLFCKSFMRVLKSHRPKSSSPEELFLLLAIGDFFDLVAAFSLLVVAV